MHSIDDIMEALQRVEITLYGDPPRGVKGISERLNQQETYVNEIRSKMDRIFWVLILGVIGAGMNLILNTKNLAAASHPPAEQSANH